MCACFFLVVVVDVVVVDVVVVLYVNNSVNADMRGIRHKLSKQVNSGPLFSGAPS